MKKILFCVRDFHTGGVQKSLLDLISQFENDIKNEKIKIDIFCLKKVGELLKNVPEYINIIEAHKSLWSFGITQSDASAEGLGWKINRGLKAVISKRFGNGWLLKRALKKQVFLGEYDAVVSWAVSISKFSLYAGWSEVALTKTQSDNKLVFIHNDFEKSSLNNPYTLDLIKKFNKIIFVSESCKNDFIEHHPDLADKCDFLYNCIDSKQIIKKSDLENISYDRNVMNILSVSRLSEEKAHIRSLDVFSRLKNEGYKFCWHVLGSGPMQNKIEDKIKELNLSDCVKLYGNKENPYPYMKSADLFYLGSFNESFGIVLVDSMILNVPAVTTNTIAAKEIVGEYGFVCENTEQGIFESLKNILDKRKVLEEKRNLLKNYEYKNEIIKGKFINLINTKGEKL